MDTLYISLHEEMTSWLAHYRVSESIFSESIFSEPSLSWGLPYRREDNVHVKRFSHGASATRSRSRRLALKEATAINN
jgi:hypothetical protein